MTLSTAATTTTGNRVARRDLVAEAMDDPRKAYARLREGGTVVYDEGTQTHYVLGLEQVRALSRDDRLRSRGFPAGVADLPDEAQAVVRPVEEFLARWMVFSDPPRQARVRRSLAPVLARGAAARAVEGLGDAARTLCERTAREGGDLVHDVALPLSRRTMAALLSLGTDELESIEVASSALIGYLAAPGFDVPAARFATVAVNDLTHLVLTTLLPRGGEVADALRSLLERGDGDQTDVVAAYAQLVTGALEPLTTALVLAVLGARRSAPHSATDVTALVEQAVAEEPPFHFAPRVAAATFSVDGHDIAAGERVVLNLLQASAEAARGCPVDHSSSLEKAVGDHVAFGAGTHYCLGAPLSRLHLAAALPAVIDSGLADLVDDGSVRRRPSFGATAFDAVRVHPRSRR